MKDTDEMRFMFVPLQALINGNINAITPHDANMQFQSAVLNLLDQIKDYSYGSEFLKLYKTFVQNIGNEMELTLIEHTKNIKPLEKIRKTMLAENISNLDPSKGKIIDQIWEIIKSNYVDLDKDRFFGKKPIIDNGKDEDSLFEAAIQCHSVLNILGYWPDKGLTKISKLYGINSDASHIAYSIFCDCVITADKRFSKKAEAILII